MSTYVIAEAGVNHNGSLDRARELVDAAVDAGADAVKFQSFRADELASATAPKAAYQTETTGSEESQLDMLRALEMDESMHRAIVDHCTERGIAFLSTPFDPASARFLVDTFDVPLLKVGSGEITNGPFLLAVARLERPVILSTGMSTLAEVEDALSVLAYGFLNDEGAPSPDDLLEAYASDAGRRALDEHVTLLHCVTEYPAPVESVNLRAMDTLRDAFQLPAGLSDHTKGITVPIAAAARGAAVVEKHFTMDRDLPGPDHRASLEPGELAAMVEGIRDVEAALGSARKAPARAEWGNRTVARRSLVAMQPIEAGEPFTTENLGVKRPGDGLSPMRYWEVLGTKANREFEAGERIEQGTAT